MQKSEVPFFARLLETQLEERDALVVRTDVKGGTRDPFPPLDHTMKYPSDDDEDVVVIETF